MGNYTNSVDVSAEGIDESLGELVAVTRELSDSRFRDECAMLAMQALAHLLDEPVTHPWKESQVNMPSVHLKRLCSESFDIADAMLAERRGRDGNA